MSEALSFHELTTQVPHTIDVALKRGTRKPRLDYPPTRFYWFSGPAFSEAARCGRASRWFAPRPRSPRPDL